MDNGFLLIITFLTPLIILTTYYIWLSKRKKKHAETLKSDWNKFEKALNHNHISGIIKYGTELVWNENLKDAQMKKMKESVYPLAEKHSELKDLKNLIYNKWLDRNKDIVRYV